MNEVTEKKVNELTSKIRKISNKLDENFSADLLTEKWSLIREREKIIENGTDEKVESVRMSKKDKINHIRIILHNMEDAIRISDIRNTKDEKTGINFLRKTIKDTGDTLFNLRRLSVKNGFHPAADEFIKKINDIKKKAENFA